MDILKTAPEFLADYANFYLQFSRRPIETIKSITMSRDGAEGQVNAKLIGFCLLSVSISFVIVRIGAALGMAEETSWGPRFAAQVGETYLPLVTLVMIFALGTISHILLKAGGVLTPVLGVGRLKGSLAGSINAFVGIASWYIPLMTVVVVAMRVAAVQPNVDPMIFLPIIVLLTVAFLIYLVAAFAGAHSITVPHAGMLFILTFGLVLLATRIFW